MEKPNSIAAAEKVGFLFPATAPQKS